MCVCVCIWLCFLVFSCNLLCVYSSIFSCNLLCVGLGVWEGFHTIGCISATPATVQVKGY